jgi:hypothetical protein
MPMASPTDDLPGGGYVDTFVHNYEGLIDAINSLHARLNNELIPQVSHIAIGLNPALLPWRGLIEDRVTELLQRLALLEKRLALLLASWPLPVRMWRSADGWVSVRHAVGAVAGDLGVTHRDVQFRWQGVAAEAYHVIVPAHSAAADRLAAVADTVQYALGWAANAAVQFYAALLGVIAGFFGAALIALASGATGVGAPAALLMLLMLVGTVLTTISSLLVSTAQSLGTAQTFMTEMLSEILDDTAFPGGGWPGARPELYSDATVTDGDPSDWAVRP